MQQDNINGQAVEVCVIAAGGTEAAEELQQGERELLEKIDAALRADAGFAKAFPEARLVRVDSNRGQADRDAGRFYLRYQHKAGIAEFWGNLADVLTVDLKGGTIGVP
jgi:hypothetical protein